MPLSSTSPSASKATRMHFSVIIFAKLLIIVITLTEGSMIRGDLIKRDLLGEQEPGIWETSTMENNDVIQRTIQDTQIIDKLCMAEAEKSRVNLNQDDEESHKPSRSRVVSNNWKIIELCKRAVMGMPARKKFLLGNNFSRLDKKTLMGFQGMRGKKDLLNGFYTRYRSDSTGLNKKASVGFHGMRGKKNEEIQPYTGLIRIRGKNLLWFK